MGGRGAGSRTETSVPIGRDRREHGVHPDAVAEPHVDQRVRFIDVASARGDEPHREVASLRFGHARRVDAHEPGTAIDPDRSRRR